MHEEEVLQERRGLVVCVPGLGRANRNAIVSGRCAVNKSSDVVAGDCDSRAILSLFVIGSPLSRK